MFVKNHLIPLTRLITVNEKENLKITLQLMEKHGHDALPVINEENVLAGLISKQHIYKINFTEESNKESFITNTIVSEIMKTNFKYIYEQDLLETAIKQMIDMRMQFIVVYNQKNEFIGILTRRILLEAMANVLGIDKKGVRVEVLVSDTKGRLATLTKTLSKNGYNVRSIFMYDLQLMDLQKILIRLDTRDLEPVVNILNNAGFKVLTSILE